MEHLRITALLSRLKEPLDSADDKLFQQIIDSTLRSGLMGEEETANGLLVSKPTVNRWRRGKNLPSKLIRLQIYNYLSERLEAHVDSEIIVLQSVLEHDDPIRDNFQLYLSQCLLLEFVSEAELADKFEVDLSIVKCWENATDSPHPFLRAHINKFLLDKVNQIDKSRRQK